MLLLVAAFQLLTAPVSAHMISRVAYRRRHVRRDLLLVDELREAEGRDGAYRGDDPRRAPGRVSAQLTQVDARPWSSRHSAVRPYGCRSMSPARAARRPHGRHRHLDVVDGAHSHRRRASPGAASDARPSAWCPRPTSRPAPGRARRPADTAS